jgi:hypothetical protein
MEDFRLSYFFFLTAFLRTDPARNAGMRIAGTVITLFVLKWRALPMFLAFTGVLANLKQIVNVCGSEKFF